MWNTEVNPPPTNELWQDGNTLDEDIRNKICRIYHTRMVIFIIGLTLLFSLMTIVVISEFVSNTPVTWPIFFIMMALMLGIYVVFCAYSARKVLVRRGQFNWTEKTIESVHIFAGLRGTIQTCVYCEGKQYKIHQPVVKFSKGDKVLCVKFEQGSDSAFKI